MIKPQGIHSGWITSEEYYRNQEQKVFAMYMFVIARSMI